MGRRFVNWAGTVRSEPRAWHAPASDDAIAEVVRATARDGGKLRVVGSGHSWSAIAAPHDVAISLGAWTGIVEVEPERGLVRVRGGTRLDALIAELATHGLALPIVGSIAAQTIAGAIATGTHGSSLVHGNLASFVDALVLIDGRGERVEIGAGDPRLDGARVHLGALGVIVEVTLRVVPAFRLAQTVEAVPIALVAGTLPAIAASAEYVKIWWLPHTPYAYIYRYARAADDERDTSWPSMRTRRWLDARVIHGGVLPVVAILQRTWRGTIAPINRAFEGTLRAPRRIGAAALMLNTPMPVVHRETEAAVPMTRADDAFARLVELIARDDLRVNFIVEARFVRGDSGWLSPAAGADTCQLGAYIGKVGDADRYFAAFWRALRPLDARPHWGKELDHDAAELARLYPELPRFLALRAALDPERVFDGPFHTRTLG